MNNLELADQVTIVVSEVGIQGGKGDKGDNAISTVFVSGISISGSNSVTGLINVIGIYGTNVILSGNNTIGISGGGAGGGLSQSQADLLYLSTGSSGAFYASTNPNQYIRSGDFNIPSSGVIINVDSIKQLRSLNITGINNHSIVNVKSYYDDSESFSNISDQRTRYEGGGLFFWDNINAYPDDSGRFIAASCSPGTGRWTRIIQGEIPTPHMWGAKGDARQAIDGTSGNYILGSDDTIPIQNALNACKSTWAGTLRFPGRAYKISDTLIWDAQQTQIIGDGCINSSIIYMKENVQKDILWSTGWAYVSGWNLSPSNPAPNGGSYAADAPKIKDIAIGYGGNTNLRGSVYNGFNVANTGNSVITMVVVGETNLIQGCHFFGGKYNLRIMGGSPGLRVYGTTFGAIGEANISLESFPSQVSGAGGWQPVRQLGAGMLSMIDCSCDYNALNSGEGGFAVVKVHNGGYQNIYIKNQKMEGDFPGGVVYCIKPSGYNGDFNHVEINGLNWNATTQDHAIDQSVVIISGEDSSVTSSVNVSLKNLYIQSVPNLIKDYILSDTTGLPYILKSNNWYAGFPYYNNSDPINHYGYKSSFAGYQGQNWTASNVSDLRTITCQTKFQPLNTGWYRIAMGKGESSMLFNEKYKISYYWGNYDVKAELDLSESPRKIFLSSSSSTYGVSSNTTKNPLTRARLFVDNTIPNGPSAFLDVFVDTLPQGATDNKKTITVESTLNKLFGNTLIAPTLLTGLDINQIAYSSNLYPYAEVDLTRAKDVSQSRTNVPKDAFLIDKDFYLFTTAGRDLRYFDAGVQVNFAGGGGSSAAGTPIIVSGAIQQVLITNSGNGGYTSPPTITITPNSIGNGAGAFISGYVLNGYISAIQVISGGAGYGIGPDSATDGYSLTGLGLTGQQLVSLINTERNKQTVTGISATGSNSITGLVNFVGIYGTNIILSGNNTIGISGGGAGGGGTTNYYINSGTGLFIYRSGISSGASSQFINFPTLLDNNPIVVATLHNDTFDNILGFQVSGANPTGFWAIFSDVPAQTGYYLDIFACDSTSTGKATTVIVNNTNIGGTTNNNNYYVGVTGVSVSGSDSITGKITIQGIYGTQVILSGNTVGISGGTSQDLSSYATISNLATTGTTLYNDIIGLSGVGNTTINNLTTTGQTLNNLINGLSGQLNQTGSNLYNLINTEKNKQTITGISISGGSSLTGLFSIVQGANITLTQLGNTGFSIAGSAGGNPSNGVTGIYVNNNNSISGAIKIADAGNVTVTQVGNTITISGNSLTSGSTLPFIFGNVNIVSGSGNSQFIQFSQNFAATPIVLGNIFNNSGDGIVGFNTSGISNSGFYLNLSDTLATNNYYFQYLATTGLGYYELALSTLNQTTTNATSAQSLMISGNPEGRLAAISGSTCIDWFNYDFYMKISGDSTNAYGWV